jgi:hypothetical protein
MPSERSMDGERGDLDERRRRFVVQVVSRQDNNDRFQAKET